jgi:hypothetical protein
LPDLLAIDLQDVAVDDLDPAERQRLRSEGASPTSMQAMMYAEFGIGRRY